MRGSIAAILLLIVQPVWFFRRILINPEAHIPYDLEYFHFPQIAYIARSVRDGVFPFWDPYSYCGVPFHADLQAQLFYPPAWIAILLGNAGNGVKLYYWVEWLIPLHMIFGGVFAFYLARNLGCSAPAALLGATVYQLGGFFASQSQHLGAISCGAWFPLVLLSVLKLSERLSARWISILGLSLAASILSGFTASAAVSLIAMCLFAFALVLTRNARWPLFGALAIAVLLAICITAVQTGPTYQLAKQSIAAIRSDWLISGGGLRVQSLASLVIPNFYNIFTPFDPNLFKLSTNFTLLYVYCGLIPLVLLAIAPFRKKPAWPRLLFVLTIVSAVWMLGDQTPFYRSLYAALPGFVKGSLYADYALMSFCLFLGMTAATVLQTAAAWKWGPALLWTAAGLTAIDLTYAGANRPFNTSPGTHKMVDSEHQLHGASRDLDWLQGLAWKDPLPPLRFDYLDRNHPMLVTGSSMLGLHSASGDNPFVLKRLLLLRRVFCGGNFWERQIPVDRMDSPLVDLLNVGYLIGGSPAELKSAQAAGFEPLQVLNAMHIYLNPEALPRFFLVPSIRPVASFEEALAEMSKPDFRPDIEAVVEGFEEKLSGDPLEQSSVHVVSYSANRVELEVRTPQRALLVSSEAMYPGWTATVNAQPARLLMTNAAFRGMLVGPGNSRIVMTYFPENFLLWLALSLGGLSAAGAGLFSSRWNKTLQSR
ncbi:MAG: YfhO family protein [Bryobacteraceae bacterium]